MNEHAIDEVLLCLSHLADPEFQERVWVRGTGPEVSSFVEVICQLFDDTGLEELLNSGDAEAVLGSEAAGELLRLQELVDAIPSRIDVQSLLHLPTWKAIMNVAKTAHSLLAGSTGG